MERGSTPPAIVDADDEADLVARAYGDPRAFALLYRRYADPVYRYCFRRLGDREAAEDATSAVFTRALGAFQRLQPEALPRSFRAWLFTIAMHIVTDAHRARRPDTALDAAGELIDPSPSPEERALAAEEGRRIRAVLAQLSDDDRRLIELRLAGLSGAEIAETLGRGHGAIRVAHHRAVARLRALHEAARRAEGALDA